jgi:hypothetical protein
LDIIGNLCWIAYHLRARQAEVFQMNINELNPETLEKLGLVQKEKRNYTFKAEDVKRHAFRVMSVLDKLCVSERKRVLTQCIKLNDV